MRCLMVGETAGTCAGLSNEPGSYLDHRDAHLDAERDLKRAGLVHAENGPHQPRVGPDVRFSLRYCNAPDSGRGDR